MSGDAHDVWTDRISGPARFIFHAAGFEERRIALTLSAREN